MFNARSRSHNTIHFIASALIYSFSRFSFCSKHSTKWLSTNNRFTLSANGQRTVATFVRDNSCDMPTHIASDGRVRRLNEGSMRATVHDDDVYFVDRLWDEAEKARVNETRTGYPGRYREPIRGGVRSASDCDAEKGNRMRVDVL